MESGTSLQQMAENTLPPLTPSLPSPQQHHHRRHLRHATPENSNSPQNIIERTPNNRRRPSNHPRSPRTPSASPPAAALTSFHQPYASMPSPGAQSGELHPAFETLDTIPPSAIEGQDHDRMETDEDDEGSDGSGTEREADTPGPATRDAETGERPPPPVEIEIMDTSPDNPPVDEPPPPEPPSQANSEAPSTQAPGDPAGLHLVQVQIPPSNLEMAQLAETINAAAAAEVNERRESQRRDRDRPTRRRREGEVNDAEGEEDSDDSSDEEEQPYWVNLKEDTSAPDERELKVIEESGDEVSAVDHEHWEKLIHEPLDDPEYIPDAVGRITWIVKGVHGTAEKPNREKIMRSPSVLIGGYYWNIKYFPHGNDGTEQLSIYIECSPTPPEEGEKKSKNAVALEDALEASQDRPANENSNPNAEHDSANPEPSTPANVGVPEREENMVDKPTPPDDSEAKPQVPWGVAAQIGCVLYNPEEPRVNVYQKGCHRYFNDSSDWGWTRFHGPWDEIHKRQRFQRQALLRNDTLAFTAYIRTVKDETKALWWHPPKDSPEWNCEAMTGVPAFECQAYQSSAVIAAMTAWMHLSIFRNIVRNEDIPDPVWEASKRMKPIYGELQDLYEEAESPPLPEEHAMSLRDLVSILNFYGAHVDSKMDVVMVWETLRRVLNFERSGLSSVEEGNTLRLKDLFGDILLLKQPDLFDNAPRTTHYVLPIEDKHFPPNLEPHSVQETIDKTLGDGVKSFRTWQSFEGQRQENPLGPTVLQIELHRQTFTKEARKWQKLTHQIKLDEEVVFNNGQYTLYGMIVHNGDLESSEYYSVLRPDGPGTRWLKFAGDNADRKVTVLTSKQAMEAHEGSGDVADGTAAVAYVVLYVRTEKLPGVLYNPFKQEGEETDKPVEPKAVTDTQEADMTDSNDNEPDMPVFIYDADAFEASGGYEGRGICDPWAPHELSNPVKELSFPASTTISKIKEHVNGPNFKIDKRENTEIRMWPMNTFITDVGVRVFPSLLSYKSYCEETIDEMGHRSGGCRFWIKSVDKAPVAAPEPPAPVTTPETNNANNREAEIATLEALLALQSAGAEANEGPRAQGSGLAEVADREMSNAGRTPQDADRRHQQLQHLVNEMQQAQQQQQQLLIAQQAQQRQLEAERNSRQLKETYFLVKVFDADNQTLRGKASAIVKSESKIVEETRKLLKTDASEPWDCYRERDIEIHPGDLIKSHETFESRCGGVDGTIIIAQRRPTAAQIAALETAGKCTTPTGYFHYLQGRDNPTLLRSHLSSSYFGSAYSCLSLKNGVPHGPGTLITLSGDAYTGNFTAGSKSGHGTMAYANGDTYTGEWKANEPNGQGQMVYAKTGNVYTGGFKKRKRHGKGMMTFEVADEEEKLCRICYECEMDALFYDCGHVVACEECARQVDVCPVCRKNVRAVVRIWRT